MNLMLETILMKENNPVVEECYYYNYVFQLKILKEGKYYMINVLIRFTTNAQIRICCIDAITIAVVNIMI